MFIDLLSLTCLLIAVFKGLRKGLIVAVFSVIGFIAGIAVALRFSSFVADYIGSNTHISQRLLPVIAFALVFFITVLLVRLGARFIEKAVNLIWLGWLNKIGGILFYLFLYFFILSTLLFFASQVHLIKEETIRTSVSYSIIEPLAPGVMNMIGLIIPSFKNIFGQLLHYFQGAS